MTNIKESAINYTGKSKNIADLEAVSVSQEMFLREGTDTEGKPYSYNVIVINGEDYRVPNSVLEQLKAVIKAKAEVKTIKVSKAGEGLSTRYTVIPLE